MAGSLSSRLNWDPPYWNRLLDGVHDDDRIRLLRKRYARAGGLVSSACSAGHRNAVYLPGSRTTISIATIDFRILVVARKELPSAFSA
jgi:hypothetical protein